MGGSRLGQTVAGKQLRWVLPAGLMVVVLTFLLLFPIVVLYLLSEVVDRDEFAYLVASWIMPGIHFLANVVAASWV
ncbi:MAG TPA: hypothetical protein VGP38_11630, partial [Rubrobacter sp.]|nr:hypothetical protein [Rubrobacter sp.]